MWAAIALGDSTEPDPLSFLVQLGPLKDISYAAFTALIIISILRGWLVTRERLQDVKEQRDKWEAAYKESEKARFEEALQNGKMVDSLRAIEHFMGEFRNTIMDHKEEGR